MFCNHCGKENKDTALICNHCGKEIQKTKLSNSEELCNNSNESQTSNATRTFINNITNNLRKIRSDKKKFKKTIAISSICSILFIAGIIVVSILSSSISIKDYIKNEIDFTGMNGYASVSENINDIIDIERLNSDIKTESEYQATSYFEDIEKYIKIEMKNNDANGKLSNGDTVTFIIKIDKNGIKNNNSFVKYIRDKDEIEKSYTVKGLKKGVVIDAFDAVECYINDTTEGSYRRHNDSGIVFKSDYNKKYTNNIEVSAADSFIKIYGEDFTSLKVSLNRANDKEIKKDTKYVKYQISCNKDEFSEYDIILDPSVKNIPVVNISYVSDSISKDDLSILTQKATEFAKERFDENDSLSEAKLYWGANLIPILAYFYETEGGYHVVYYSALKKYDNDSRIYNIENQEVRSSWFYEKISDFESDMIENNAKATSLIVK